MLRRFVSVIAASGLSALLGLPAAADTIDNPGDFTLTFTAGAFIIGNRQRPIYVYPPNPPTLMGSVDSAGNVVIPQAGIFFPDAFITVLPYGGTIVRIMAAGDASGTLNALTGASTVTVNLSLSFINPSLPGGCGIGPINISFTTGESGTLTGVPYDQASGTATYVSNDFSVPEVFSCGILEDLSHALHQYFGVPADAGVSSTQLNAQFDPIFVGS